MVRISKDYEPNSLGYGNDPRITGRVVAIFHPSSDLKGVVRKTKVEGFYFGLFFTALSISLAIIYNELLYLYIAITLLIISNLSVIYVFWRTKVLFNQDYVLTTDAIYGIFRNRIVLKIDSEEALQCIVIRDVKGSSAYYSLFFFPNGLLGKMRKISEEPISWHQLTSSVYEYGGMSSFVGRIRWNVPRRIRRRYFLNYLDYELARKIRSEYYSIISNQYFTGKNRTSHDTGYSVK